MSMILTATVVFRQERKARRYRLSGRFSFPVCLKVSRWRPRRYKHINHNAIHLAPPVANPGLKEGRIHFQTLQDRGAYEVFDCHLDPVFFSSYANLSLCRFMFDEFAVFGIVRSSITSICYFRFFKVIFIFAFTQPVHSSSRSARSARYPDRRAQWGYTLPALLPTPFSPLQVKRGQRMLKGNDLHQFLSRRPSKKVSETFRSSYMIACKLHRLVMLDLQVIIVHPPDGKR